MLVVEHHHGRCRCDDLGERREIVERALGRHRRARRRPVQRAVAAREHRRSRRPMTTAAPGNPSACTPRSTTRSTASSRDADIPALSSEREGGRQGTPTVQSSARYGQHHHRVTSARGGAQRSPSFVTASCRARRPSSRASPGAARGCRASGRRSTATRSASSPALTAPSLSSRCSTFASTLVAARSACDRRHPVVDQQLELARVVAVREDADVAAVADRHAGRERGA